MRSRTILLTLALFLYSLNLFAIESKVIYGPDDRVDVYDSPNDFYTELSRATAAKISPNYLRKSDDGEFYHIWGTTLSGDGICPEERFAHQATPASCSGFLVGPDLLVTAGHCMQSYYDCSTHVWVFDFKADSKDQTSFRVPRRSVYQCERVLEKKYHYSGDKNDYAIVKLSRKVTDREPLEFRREGEITVGTPIFVIGHPSGLPTKISGNAKVRSVEEWAYFTSNLDTFSGNSGSAVFNADTGMVEGILVRGDQDYVYDEKRGCEVPKRCKDEECKGEDVTRITNINYLKNL